MITKPKRVRPANKSSGNQSNTTSKEPNQSRQRRGSQTRRQALHLTSGSNGLNVSSESIAEECPSTTPSCSTAIPIPSDQISNEESRQSQENPPPEEATNSVSDAESGPKLKRKRIEKSNVKNDSSVIFVDVVTQNNSKNSTAATTSSCSGALSISSKQRSNKGTTKSTKKPQPKNVASRYDDSNGYVVISDSDSESELTNKKTNGVVKDSNIAVADVVAPKKKPFARPGAISISAKEKADSKTRRPIKTPPSKNLALNPDESIKIVDAACGSKSTGKKAKHATKESTGAIAAADKTTSRGGAVSISAQRTAVLKTRQPIKKPLPKNVASNPNESIECVVISDSDPESESTHKKTNNVDKDSNDVVADVAAPNEMISCPSALSSLPKQNVNPKTQQSTENPPSKSVTLNSNDSNDCLVTFNSDPKSESTKKNNTKDSNAVGVDVAASKKATFSRPGANSLLRKQKANDKQRRRVKKPLPKNVASNSDVPIVEISDSGSESELKQKEVTNVVNDSNNAVADFTVPNTKSSSLSDTFSTLAEKKSSDCTVKPIEKPLLQSVPSIKPTEVVDINSESASKKASDVTKNSDAIVAEVPDDETNSSQCADLLLSTIEKANPETQQSNENPLPNNSNESVISEVTDSHVCDNDVISYENYEVPESRVIRINSDSDGESIDSSSVVMYRNFDDMPELLQRMTSRKRPTENSDDSEDVVFLKITKQSHNESSFIEAWREREKRMARRAQRYKNALAEANRESVSRNDSRNSTNSEENELPERPESPKNSEPEILPIPSAPCTNPNKGTSTIEPLTAQRCIPYVNNHTIQQRREILRNLKLSGRCELSEICEPSTNCQPQKRRALLERHDSQHETSENIEPFDVSQYCSTSSPRVIPVQLGRHLSSKKSKHSKKTVSSRPKKRGTGILSENSSDEEYGDGVYETFIQGVPNIVAPKVRALKFYRRSRYGPHIVARLRNTPMTLLDYFNHASFFRLKSIDRPFLESLIRAHVLSQLDQYLDQQESLALNRPEIKQLADTYYVKPTEVCDACVRSGNDPNAMKKTGTKETRPHMLHTTEVQDFHGTKVVCENPLFVKAISRFPHMRLNAHNVDKLMKVIAPPHNRRIPHDPVAVHTCDNLYGSFEYSKHKVTVSDKMKTIRPLIIYQTAYSRCSWEVQSNAIDIRIRRCLQRNFFKSREPFTKHRSSSRPPDADSRRHLSTSPMGALRIRKSRSLSPVRQPHKASDKGSKPICFKSPYQLDATFCSSRNGFFRSDPDKTRCFLSFPYRDGFLSAAFSYVNNEQSVLMPSRPPGFNASNGFHFKRLDVECVGKSSVKLFEFTVYEREPFEYLSQIRAYNVDLVVREIRPVAQGGSIMPIRLIFDYLRLIRKEPHSLTWQKKKKPPKKNLIVTSQKPPAAQNIPSNVVVSVPPKRTRKPNLERVPFTINDVFQYIGMYPVFIDKFRPKYAVCGGYGTIPVLEEPPTLFELMKFCEEIEGKCVKPTVEWRKKADYLTSLIKKRKPTKKELAILETTVIPITPKSGRNSSMRYVKPEKPLSIYEQISLNKKLQPFYNSLCTYRESDSDSREHDTDPDSDFEYDCGFVIYNLTDPQKLYFCDYIFCDLKVMAVMDFKKRDISRVVPKSKYLTDKMLLHGSKIGKKNSYTARKGHYLKWDDSSDDEKQSRAKPFSKPLPIGVSIFSDNDSLFAEPPAVCIDESSTSEDPDTDQHVFFTFNNSDIESLLKERNTVKATKANSPIVDVVVTNEVKKEIICRTYGQRRNWIRETMFYMNEIPKRSVLLKHICTNSSIDVFAPEVPEPQTTAQVHNEFVFVTEAFEKCPKKPGDAQKTRQCCPKQPIDAQETDQRCPSEILDGYETDEFGTIQAMIAQENNQRYLNEAINAQEVDQFRQIELLFDEELDEDVLLDHQAEKNRLIHCWLNKQEYSDEDIMMTDDQILKDLNSKPLNFQTLNLGQSGAPKTNEELNHLYGNSLLYKLTFKDSVSFVSSESGYRYVWENDDNATVTSNLTINNIDFEDDDDDDDFDDDGQASLESFEDDDDGQSSFEFTEDSNVDVAMMDNDDDDEGQESLESCENANVKAPANENLELTLPEQSENNDGDELNEAVPEANMEAEDFSDVSFGNTFENEEANEAVADNETLNDIQIFLEANAPVPFHHEELDEASRIAAEQLEAPKSTE